MKLLSVCSARPNFVKLASIYHAFSAAKLPDSSHVIVHTGQHYDPLLSDIFFTQLQIPQPKHNLGIHGGTREEVIMHTTEALLPLLAKEKPDIVLVYGDVNGAVGAARAAKKLGIKIAHVEAGLRSGDLGMPEEHNRIEIDQLADVLFTTEKSAEDNIRKEKLKGEVHFVGNTMIDTLIRMMPVIDAQKGASALLRGITFAIATLHRPSNVDEENSLHSNLDFFKEIAHSTQVLLPGHPRLLASLERFGIQIPALRASGITVTESYDYLRFLHLMKKSSFILTDSGGIQEEAVLLGKRCFTLRRNTERPSTIESGSNVLIDPEHPVDLEKVLEFAKNPVAVDVHIPPLWDGKAGERIIAALRIFLQQS